MATKGIGAAFERAIEEGEIRLNRTTPQLIATGTMGGIDVGIGVFALLLVLEHTDEPMMAAIAFTIGFVALTLGRSELFTENFLVPIAALTSGDGRWPSLGRLWIGSTIGNLIGGLAIAGIIVVGFPALESTAVDVGGHFTEVGISARSFATAVLAGIIITLMTWMEQGTDSTVGHLAAAVTAGWALAYGELNHAVVASIEMFAALQFGAPFGYADWLGAFGWAAFGNLVGGLGLVTVLRLVQVRAHDGETVEP